MEHFLNIRGPADKFILPNLQLLEAKQETTTIIEQAKEKNHPFYKIPEDVIIRTILGYKHDLERRSVNYFRLETKVYLTSMHRVRVLSFAMDDVLQHKMEQVGFIPPPGTRTRPQQLLGLTSYMFKTLCKQRFVDAKMKQGIRDANNCCQILLGETINQENLVSEGKEEWVNLVKVNFPLEWNESNTGCLCRKFGFQWTETGGYVVFEF